VALWRIKSISFDPKLSFGKVAKKNSEALKKWKHEYTVLNNMVHCRPQEVAPKFHNYFNFNSISEKWSTKMILAFFRHAWHSDSINCFIASVLYDRFSSDILDLSGGWIQKKLFQRLIFIWLFSSDKKCRRRTRVVTHQIEKLARVWRSVHFWVERLRYFSFLPQGLKFQIFRLGPLQSLHGLFWRLEIERAGKLALKLKIFAFRRFS
jgi:hypothetical protein